VHDLLDQLRGTGTPPAASAARSEADCQVGQGGPTGATKLGARVDYYLTADTVGRLDALRARSGFFIAEVVLLTRLLRDEVASQYAQRHPDRVVRLVLTRGRRARGPDPLYGRLRSDPACSSAVFGHSGLCRSSRTTRFRTSKLVAKLAGGALRAMSLGGRRPPSGEPQLRPSTAFRHAADGRFDESLRPSSLPPSAPRYWRPGSDLPVLPPTPLSVESWATPSAS